jgi:uncharacterized RDD family membrane protein YckC
MSDGYYILEEEEQKGPFTFDELMDMDIDIHSSILSPATDTWQDACDLPELYPYFEAQGIYLPTGDNLASFGWRFLAFIIDNFALSILINFVIVFLSSIGISYKAPTYDELFKLSPAALLPIALVNSLIYSITLIIYNTICEASPMKGSVGKRIFKMVVVDVDGMGLSFLNALLRSVGKALSIFFFYLGFLSILFTEHRQAVHDLLAKTYVVKRDQ